MDTQRIRYFAEVFNSGSFSKAAAACRISQPSLSQQIKKLEDEVGGQLFFRSRDGIKLSELGEKFLPYAYEILKAVHSANDFVNQSSKHIDGKIRIGSIPTIGPFLLPKLIRFIRRKHPKIQYEITENTTNLLIEKLRNGEIDFALLSPPTAIDSDVDHIDLFEDELLITLPLEHVLNQETAISIELLKDEKLIVLPEAHCLTGQIKAFCKAGQIEAKLSFESSQMDTLLGFVELGLGISFTPKIAVGNLSHHKVKFHSVSPSPYTRMIRLIWLRRNIPSITQSAVISCVNEFDLGV